MNLKFEKLRELYSKHDKNKDIYDDTMRIIDFYTKDCGKYKVNLRFQIYNHIYSVYVSIEEYNKVILNVQFKNNMQLEEYILIKEELEKINFDDFIDKHYTSIQKN